MPILKPSEIETNSEDNFLYSKLIKLFSEIKIIQGGTALASTLRRHSRLKNYCIAKQIAKLTHIEQTYFYEDGRLNDEAVKLINQKSTLQH